MDEPEERSTESHAGSPCGKRKGGLRLLVVGAGRVGARILLQLRKNPALTVITVDPREAPFAVEEGIIASVDYQRELIPGELEMVIEEVTPDLVLVTASREDVGRSGIPGLEILVEALRQELEATAKVPIIAVSVTGIG